MNKALFLDRDGVINERIVGGYVQRPDEFHLIDAILPVLQAARAAGYKLVLITNQQGVGKGLMSREDLDALHRHLHDLLISRLGFGLDAVYDCTSLASEGDPRRKPEPGMLLDAIADLDLDPAQCWFLGDSRSDAEAGRRAGVRTILLGEHPSTAADVVVQSLSDVLPLVQ